jgi:hypothetical protein
MPGQISFSKASKISGSGRFIQNMRWIHKNIIRLSGTFLIVLVIISCNKNGLDTNHPPAVLSIKIVQPLKGRPGDTIIIVGSNFNPNPAMDTVKFNGITAHVQSAQADTLYVIVPAGNSTGVVTVNGIASPGPTFSMSLGLTITVNAVKPLAGKPGDTIVITGKNFNPNLLLDTVKFNGIPARVIIAKSDTLIVLVPPGNGTGMVTVNGTPGPGPVFTEFQNNIIINSVNPDWGKKGDTIKITGTNFNPNPAKDTVTINGVVALVQKVVGDSMYVLVPLTSTGPIFINGIHVPVPDFIYGATVMVTTFAGITSPPYYAGGYTDGPASLAMFNNPTGICFDQQGNLLVSEYGNGSIREIAAGTVSTLVGSQTGSYIIGPQWTASLPNLCGIATDAQGNIFVTAGGFALDLFQYEGYHSPVSQTSIEKISNGVASTIAQGFYNAGPMVFDAQGNLYEGESGIIRKITPDGQVTPFAGKAATFGIVWLDSPYRYSNQWTLNNGYQDGQDTAARFGDLGGMAIDAEGNIYAADMGCSCIRKVTPSGLVSFFAAASAPYTPATPPVIPNWVPYTGPLGICLDATGNIYTTVGNTIVKISPAGVTTTIAGSNTPGFADGPASIAQFDNPNAILVDASGNLYISDAGNQRIRKITFQP